MSILENIPLSEHTTLKIGGNARYFAVAESETDVRYAVEFSRQKGIPFFVIGGGSNLFVSDNGFFGLVVKIAILKVSYPIGIKPFFRLL